MKKIWVFLFLTLSLTAFSQDRKVSVGGKMIILHDDFTWEFAPNGAVEEGLIELQTSSDQTGLLKSRSGKYTVKYDPSQWISKKSSNAAAEFEFSNAAGTGFIMVVYDGLQIPLESLKAVMIQNASNLDPNAAMIAQRPAVVNGVEGEIVTYTATANNLTFIFYSFISTSGNGTIQFTCFTLDSAFEGLVDEFHKAMAGLVLE